MHRAAFLFCLATLTASPPQDRVLERQIEQMIAGSETAPRAVWGIHVVDLSTHETLCDLNSRHFFTPASNMKLFTTALALLRLGPDYRFSTRVLAVPPDDSGRIRGDVRLLGGGDPTLSGRVLPYRKGTVTGNPLQAIDELAAQVAAHGVQRIDGDVLGDDTVWPWEPYPPGWAVDDTVNEDGAPVSALTVNDNYLKLRLLPGAAAGQPARLSVDPPLPYFFFRNDLLTVARKAGNGAVEIDRAPGSREVRLRGALEAKGGEVVEYLAVDDPALYAATALRDALLRRGIQVRGRAVAVHRLPGEPPYGAPGGKVLASRESAPLLESLRAIDKVSQNLEAEMVLRATALARRGDGSREFGIEELRAFLAELEIAKEEYRFEDASGLSRLTVVTPRALTTLLTYMHASKYRDQWTGLLPVGGEDGTLEKRFGGHAEASRIHAKTGSLSHVATLSGYAQSRSGALLAFSILANNFNGPGSDIRAIIDRIALLLVNRE